MIERHYDDEALISLLESNRAATDTHLPSCTPCSEKIESFRLIAEALTDGDVWDTRELRTAAVPSTIATLRAFADRMTDEDARAALILPELLAGPRETWMPRLHEHPEWRTAGVVRGLIAAAYDAVMQMPPDAVEMTRMAVEIADGLDAPASQNTALLRGSAWRNHAYTLYYVGSFNDARRAIAAANAAFVGFASDTYESARLGIVESLVLRAFERIDDAMCVAESSAQIFDVFSDVDRGASARLAEVHLLFSRNEYSKADAVLRQLDAQLTDTEFVDTHARVLGNLGICARKLGKPDEAVRYLEMSAALNA
ncbi:MAG: tetratricopeptide repeat protein, partial [Acidobacteriota bacterium]|nr:tetratricopeptide repeat protein [Acidobacteriota bacterium]